MTMYIDKNTKFIDILKYHGTVVNANGKTFYFLPFWYFESSDNGDFLIEYKLDNPLPDELVDFIKKMKENTKETPPSCPSI